MDNQHRKISGYRDFDEETIATMNAIKAHGVALGELVDRLRVRQHAATAQHGEGDSEPLRWISIGATHLQQGLMALTRAVAKPEFF